MASVYLIQSSTLTNIANAIRSKIGTSSTMTPDNMVIKINSMTGGYIAPYEYESSTMTSYYGSEKYFFNYAFASCTALTTVSLPVCSYIGGDAFYMCTALTTVSLPVCEWIGSYAFNSCKSLTKANFSKCEYIGGSAFRSCTALTTVNVPKCSYIGNSAFYGCSSLSMAYFPVCSYIGSGAFRSCYSLTQAMFPKCSYIGNSAFYGCSLLSSLFLNQVPSVPTLSSTTAFDSSPLSAGGTGKIYVPKSLYTSFLRATNWSTLSARLVSM